VLEVKVANCPKREKFSFFWPVFNPDFTRMPLSHPERLQTLAWTGVGLALVGLLYLLSPILTPFAVAGILAYICDPLVQAMVDRRLPRPVAVLAVILLLGFMMFAVLLIPLPLIYRETLLLIERLPDLIEMAQTRLGPWLKTHLELEMELDASTLRGWLREHWTSTQAQDLVHVVLEQIRSGGVALIGVLTHFFLIPVVMFYLLQEWPRLMKALRNIVPRPFLPKTLAMLDEVDAVLSQFLRGQLSVMVILAVFYAIALSLVGLRFALPVAAITGLLCFIPYVGFATGLLLALVAALVQGEGVGLLMGVGLVYGLGQLIESFGLTPYLVGERVGLHPLAVIFALMAFGQLFGFVGVLLALPASAVLLVGIREVHQLYLQSPVYRGWGHEASLLSPKKEPTKK
jgi:predicted PurR-regulated permease PerM